MKLEAIMRLSLLAALCYGKMSRRQKKELVPWFQSTNPGTGMPPALNDIQLEGIKWREMLAGGAAEAVLAEKGPGRRSWCRSRRFRLRLKGEAGCSSRRVTARLCQGQCTSVWVPRPGTDYWASCPVCVPVLGSWITPSLLCPDGRTRPAQSLFRVKKCRCRETTPPHPN